MPMVCSICAHPDRDRIEEAIIGGGSLRGIAGQFDVGREAVRRHKVHISETMTKVERRRADRLEDRIEHYLDHLDSVIADGKKQGRPAQVIQGVREARGLLRLRGEVTREIGGEVPGDVARPLADPEFRRFVQGLIGALGAHPEALPFLRSLLDGGQVPATPPIPDAGVEKSRALGAGGSPGTRETDPDAPGPSESAS